MKHEKQKPIYKNIFIYLFQFQGLYYRDKVFRHADDYTKYLN
jgi:hypothetical protein